MRRSTGTWAWRTLRLVVVLTLLWWVLAGNAGWGFGGVIIMAATLAGVLFTSPQTPHWSLPGLVWFIAYFLKASLYGGIDVTRRALHPALPLQPTWINHPLRLPVGPARVLFVSTISLLPGTLSTDLDGDTLLVHALTDEAGIAKELLRLEERAAALFSIALDAHPAKEGKDG